MTPPEDNTENEQQARQWLIIIEQKNALFSHATAAAKEGEGDSK